MKLEYNQKIDSHLSDAPEARCLVEEGCTDALPDDVPVRAAADELHLLVLHDLLQLGAHLPHLPHRLDVDEVVRAPARRVPVSKGVSEISLNI